MVNNKEMFLSNFTLNFVVIFLNFRSISKVDDVNMEYSLHFTFREEWVDERLLFNSDALKHIVLSAGQKIWLPDTFFQVINEAIVAQIN